MSYIVSGYNTCSKSKLHIYVLVIIMLQKILITNYTYPNIFATVLIFSLSLKEKKESDLIIFSI